MNLSFFVFPEERHEKGCEYTAPCCLVVHSLKSEAGSYQHASGLRGHRLLTDTSSGTQTPSHRISPFILTFIKVPTTAKWNEEKLTTISELGAGSLIHLFQLVTKTHSAPWLASFYPEQPGKDTNLDETD